MKHAPVLTAAWIGLVVCHGAQAQPGSDALRAAAQKAIATNPEVTARANALRAARDGIDAARGAWLPRVDLEAGVGRTSDRITSRAPQSVSQSRNGVALSLNQVIWDGLATFSEVRRTGHERWTRYFELQDTTEQTALEAVRAAYDVARFRQLVKLAEESYVQHKVMHAQIDSRFRAGVGRGVDFEQAEARLALAESNLATELANLHDVSARFQRIVGEPPPAVVTLPTPLSQGIATSAAEAAGQATSRAPTINATIENLRAQRALVEVRRSSLQPRIEARVRSGSGRNFDGVPDQKRDTSGELLLSWNLFNGGTDQARVRQQVHLLSQAADLRDRACRDARQTAAIAFNDTRKLTEQLGLLDRNALAIAKARDAYRQQFDIGQRSLLDLLNSENELYAARRAYANAEADLGIAFARSHAASMQLLPRLGLSPAETGLDPSEAASWAAGEDAPGRCPAEAVVIPPSDRAALDARAASLQRAAPTAVPAPVPRR